MQNQNKSFKYIAERINYKGKQIQTYTFGTGTKTILSIPSFPHSGLYYILFTQFYDPSKFRFITLDIPGWAGWSDNIFKDTQYSYEELISILEAILKYYNVKKYRIIGYSFGGALAISLAARNIEKIQKLAIVSTIINGDLLNGTPQKLKLKLAKKLHQQRRLKSYIVKEVIKYQKELMEKFQGNLYYQYLSMLDNADVNVLFQSLYHLFHTDLTPDLQKLKGIKDLLLVNSKDEEIIFRRQVEYIRRIIACEQSFKISGRHEHFILKPKSETVKRILDFLLTD